MHRTDLNLIPAMHAPTGMLCETSFVARRSIILAALLTVLADLLQLHIFLPFWFYGHQRKPAPPSIQSYIRIGRSLIKITLQLGSVATSRARSQIHPLGIGLRKWRTIGWNSTIWLSARRSSTMLWQDTISWYVFMSLGQNLYIRLLTRSLYCSLPLGNDLQYPAFV